MRKMLMVTGLPVWSLGVGLGAPSFYKTLEIYNNRGWEIDFWTTEKTPQISELSRVKIKKIPTIIPLINIPKIYYISRNIRFLLNQILIIIMFLMKKRRYDILYGYEVEFIPGLSFLSRITGIPLVSRFQGTILYPLMGKKIWKFLYISHSWPLSINTSLTIMTDDGTMGDYVIKVLRKNLQENIWFVRNGIDDHIINERNVSTNILKIINQNKDKLIFSSISRMVGWKRIDRSLDIFQRINNKYPDSIYLIGGDGEKKSEWEEYSRHLNIASDVFFLGSISKDEVYYIQQRSQFFLSSYELSNMGNPVFEAMKNQCVVATISNGSTGTLIKDGVNGIISSEDSYLENADKIIQLIDNHDKYAAIQEASLSTFYSQFKTWDARMQEEVDRVEKLIKHLD
jgi:glycosyltransferase involved in cell wall biosynthesis